MITLCYVYDKRFELIRNLFLDSLEPAKDYINIKHKNVSSKYKDSGFRSSSWYEITKFKIDFLYDEYNILLDNEIIVFSDIDVYYNQPLVAFETIQKEFDLNNELSFLGMLESTTLKEKSNVINTGFFAIKKNKETKIFFEKLINYDFRQFFYSDQDAINKILQQQKINYKVLDSYRFVNACYFKDIIHKKDIYVLHASCFSNIEEKKSFIQNFISTKNVSNNLLVVSKFEENINWIKKINIPHLIYDKSKNIEINDKNLNIQKIENIGYEEFGYLNFIVDHYYSLPDRVIFAQADPFQHSPNFIKLLEQPYLEKYNDVQPLTNFWKEFLPGYDLRRYTKDVLQIQDIPIHVDFFDSINRRYNIFKNCFEYYPKKHQQGFSLYLFNKLKTNNIRKTVFETINIKPRNFEDKEMTPMCYAAIFSVTKERILMYPKKYYESLLKINYKMKNVQYADNKLFGLIMELAWLELFRYNPPEELYNLEKYTYFLSKIENKSIKNYCEFIYTGKKTAKKNKIYECKYCNNLANEYDIKHFLSTYKCKQNKIK